MVAKSKIYLIFVVLAGLCWGTYIPMVAQGGKELKSSYASFLCVGVAYFLIAILLPVAILWARGKMPQWNVVGIAFATLAGVAGALGALCVVLAVFEFNGPRIFVAPVIFALAPVINTLVSLFWHPDAGALAFGLPRERPHWTLYVGIVCAGTGAGLALLAKELTEAVHAKPPEAAANPVYLAFVILAGLCWGTYVPLIAQGGKQLKSSYASFLCVGVAYFVIAVLFPIAAFVVKDFPSFNATGTTLATLAGAAGAVGALCVIFATFEFQGPKIYVAPVIFALAPVIATLVSLFWHPAAGRDALIFGLPEEPPHWTLYFGIVLAGAGAGLVLFAKELTESRHASPKSAVAPMPTPAVEPAQQ
jgi:drug/metabolite transporter (DMT)-like permease